MRIRGLIRSAAKGLIVHLQRLSGAEGIESIETSEGANPPSSDPWKDLVRSIRLDLHETARPVLLCFECNKLALVEDVANVVRDSFLGAAPMCPACGTSINVWMNTLLAVTTDGGLTLATQVGARHTAIVYPLAVGVPTVFDLRERGVPRDATILRIAHRASLTDSGRVVDLDGTDSARAPNFIVRVLGVSLGDLGSADMQATTTVTWAHHDADDDGRRSLNRALLAIADGRLEEAIVPANVAVEVTLAAVLDEHLRAIGISKHRLKPFLTDAATYSHQLNVLLPTILWGTGAPVLDPYLRGVLNRLRDLRNGIGHRGKSKQPLTREIVGECIAGAVFGFHYARLAGEFLSRRRDEQTDKKPGSAGDESTE